MDYKKIDGWFDFEDVYTEQVKNANDGAVFVEVGCHKGRSTVYLAELIKSSGKKIDLYCIDIWEDEKVYMEFIDNISSYPFVYPVRDRSTNIDIKADFVFIDADHDYYSVKDDLKHWLPRTKKIAGHDYSEFWPGVVKAVDETFSKYEIIGNSWIGISH